MRPCHAIAMWLSVTMLPGVGAPASLIFQSPRDDGSEPQAPARIPIGGSQELHLYIDAGGASSAPEEVCESGSGDEICLWDIDVEATGSLLIESFEATRGVVWRLEPKRLRANGGDPIHGELGPVKLGTLVVRAVGDDGSLSVRGRHYVDAGLSLHDLPASTLAVTDDNCPNIPNPEQMDTDGNGIGDLCQCGDVNGDGMTNVTDALAIARGEIVSTHPGFPMCDVNGDGACNVTDALGIARGEPGSAHEDQRCPAYVGAP